MPNMPNMFGGGARTNANGLCFEQTTSLDCALRNAGYVVDNCKVYNGSEVVGLFAQKHNFYKYFLKPNGIDYRNYNSKQWLPDECFVNFQNKTVYIIEKKFQSGAGSVDEKLPGCDFKRKEYEKLCEPLGYKVEYIYVFNDWFKKDKYKDTFEYIENVECHYFFNEIPLEKLGL